MKAVRRFFRFWWNFIVGDDWIVAAELAIALVVTGLLQRGGVSAWWCLPVAVSLILVGSIRRAARGSA